MFLTNPLYKLEECKIIPTMKNEIYHGTRFTYETALSNDKEWQILRIFPLKSARRDNSSKWRGWRAG